MNDLAVSVGSRLASAYSEEAVTFGGGRWVGVLSVPTGTPQSVVIVVVGGPQYRVGSHRQFVQLSRALASAGHATLRFDYTAKEFLGTVEQDASWKGSLQRRDLSRHDVAQADHTFSGVATRLQLEELTVNWLDELGRRYPTVVPATPTTRT